MGSIKKWPIILFANEHEDVPLQFCTLLKLTFYGMNVHASSTFFNKDAYFLYLIILCIKKLAIETLYT